MPTIRGQFDDDRPFIEAVLRIPRFLVEDRVSFMVDTGADITVLAPRDAIRIGVDLSAIREWQPAIVTSVGIGFGFVEPAFARFSASNRAYDYGVGLLVAAPNPQTLRLPSLLGRDVLHRWNITYNFSRRRLSFTIVDADASVRIN